MYNRYLPHADDDFHRAFSHDSKAPPCSGNLSATGIFSSLADKLHLNRIDREDLLLGLILILLYNDSKEDYLLFTLLLFFLL